MVKSCNDCVNQEICFENHTCIAKIVADRVSNNKDELAEDNNEIIAGELVTIINNKYGSCNDWRDSVRVR